MPKKTAGHLRSAMTMHWLLHLVTDGLTVLLINTIKHTILPNLLPRKAESVWSKTNRDLIEKLTAQGRMKPNGLRIVHAAKANGRWSTAYDSSKNSNIPDDFLQEVGKDKKAFAFFESLNKANTYAIVWRLQTAKTPEMRMKRMEKILAMLKNEEKFH